MGRRLLPPIAAALAAVALAAAAATLLPARPANAHRMNLAGAISGFSRSGWHVEADDLVADLVVPRADAVALLSRVSEAARTILRDDAIATVVAAGIHVTRGDAPCSGAIEPPATLDRDAFRLRLRYACASDEGPYRVRFDLLQSMPPDHKHLANIADVAGARSDILAAKSARFDFQPGQPARPAYWGFFPLGIEHIVGGYDHLIFLGGLILLGGRLRTLLATVTAFTVAHSITLALAALEVWNPGAAVIEPAIGLTIAYVGIENLFLKEPVGRWRIAFVLGLIHGFGFAAALGEAGLARSQIVPALLLFNLGVESGQVAVLALALPVVLWARRADWFKLRAVPAASVAVAATGLALFVLRVTG